MDYKHTVPPPLSHTTGTNNFKNITISFTLLDKKYIRFSHYMIMDTEYIKILKFLPLKFQ